jgi:hypothetical protein
VRAELEESFYNVAVTPDELWRAVGESLLQTRHRRGWKPIDVERHAGPSYKTVQAIERGQVGTVQSLAQHAAALGVSIVDVIESVLTDARTPVTPEAAQIVRQFGEMTVAGRTALLAMATALLEGHAAGPGAAGPEPIGPPTPAAPGQSPRGPRGTARRKSR